MAAGAETNWADEIEDEEGGPAPAEAKAAPAAADPAELISKAKVEDAADVDAGEPDEPDLSLKKDKLDDSAAADSGVQTELASGVSTPYQSAKTFKELGLGDQLLEGVFNVMKFERPSKIQAESLPMILDPPYRNLIAQAHNGSGKTTCFVLGMLSRCDPAVQAPQALCISPTRELAIQNLDRTQKMGTFVQGLSYGLVVPGDKRRGGGGRPGPPGISQADQAAEAAGAKPVGLDGSKVTNQILVGTPGRMADLVRRRKIALEHVKVVVFDEADEMLARGFRDFSVTLLREIDKRRGSKGGCQKILFSATFSDEVKDFALSKFPNANKIFIVARQLKVDLIKQYRVRVPSKEAKQDVVARIFELGDLGQTIVFVRTRDSARKMHSAMAGEGHKCTSITGDMPPSERDKVVREFVAGTTRTMIATDVLSRGFDVDNVTLVVNHDVPTERTGQPAYETYLHRVGRTGRFGRKGAAFNLVLGSTEEAQLEAICTRYNIPLEDVKWDDEEAVLNALERAGLSNV